MASKSVIARRYAKAFSSELSDNSKAETALSELESLVVTINGNEELQGLLFSPSFSVEEKWNVLSDLLSKAGASDETTRFLKVLVLAKRVDVIKEVAAQFKEQLFKRLDKAEALIESAYALTDNELEAVKTNLEKSVGKKLLVKTEIKPELVAGLKVTVDGKTIDGTLGSHLDKMQRTLLQAEA